jgi:inorganic pyrophosphatase
MNVGDNIGDIGGMTADLFGSFSEAICAALVLSCTSIEGWREEGGCELYLSNLMYPLVLVALSILVCMLVSAVATNILWIE